jgi:hypothetical protein
MQSSPTCKLPLPRNPSCSIVPLIHIFELCSIAHFYKVVDIPRVSMRAYSASIYAKEKIDGIGSKISGIVDK